jgi:ribonuclease HI
MTKAKLFTDGGARGNPGPAAIGGILYLGDQELERFGQTIGETTNNQAEYQALYYGLDLALKHKIEELFCYLDSELVVQQLNLEYKVKNKDLQRLFVKVWNLSQQFKRVKFYHLPRAKNKIADQMVNLALDKS